jgi:hypothetical protein
VSAHDDSIPADDCAERVHDAEHRDPRLANAAIRATLARSLAFLERKRLADRRRAPCAASAKWEDSLARRPKCGAAQLCVRVDRVSAAAEVVNDRSDDELDVIPTDGVSPHGHQLSCDAARGLETVQGAAGEADRVRPLVGVSQRSW